MIEIVSQLGSIRIYHPFSNIPKTIIALPLRKNIKKISIAIKKINFLKIKTKNKFYNKLMKKSTIFRMKKT
jgi:hypothetical protein